MLCWNGLDSFIILNLNYFLSYGMVAPYDTIMVNPTLQFSENSAHATISRILAPVSLEIDIIKIHFFSVLWYRVIFAVDSLQWV